MFSVCFFFIFLHSVLPWYEDVFTLLPEPYTGPVPKEGGPEGADVARPPGAQVMPEERTLSESNV